MLHSDLSSSCRCGEAPNNKSMDPDHVQAIWDAAADGYARGQREGVDHFRYAFFGPAQRAVVGDVKGKRLLDVGCGAGYFSRLMAEAGAEVTGVDISPRMVEHARAAGGEISYHAVDAAKLAQHFEPQSFDVATSCIALQDMADPALAFRAIHAVLKPQGRFIASIEHPFGSMPVRFWARGAGGAKLHLCVDRYFDRGTRTFTWERWPTQFTTTAHHAPLEDWFTWIVEAGFSVRGFREPVPSPETAYAYPTLGGAMRVPYFAIFDLAA